MCGITGWWKRKEGEVPAKTLVHMSHIIEHRGPDDEGFALIDTIGSKPPTFDEAVRADPLGYDLGLASRRLSILDLSSLGHMPMRMEHATIVYNGEVYNFVELRRELEQLGYTFQSQGDTEVLLRAYLHWGTDCLKRLNGMFAFAIWDSKEHALFCARDHFGIKPFYYYLSDDEFIFGSEIRSILAALEKKPAVNEPLIYDFIAVNRLDHTDETFYRNILRIPAGGYLLLTRDTAKSDTYWKLSPTEESLLSFEDATDRMRELFDSSIEMQMRSDVPVGSCLSGGMDSSVLVSVAGPHAQQMKCFTARYRDPSMDEWGYAKAVIEKYHAIGIEAFAEPTCFLSDLREFLDCQEEPVATPAQYAHWILQKVVKPNGVTVLLDGQGGDELMCGYAKYFYFSLMEMRRRHQYGALMSTGARALVNGGKHLVNIHGAKKYLPKVFKGQTHELMRPEFREKYAQRPIELPPKDVRGLQIFDVEKLSLPVLLRYEDKNSMWHSLESRVPFLDYRLAEFLVSLPTGYKLIGGQSKRVMRSAYGDRLPDKVRNRRSKLGFGGSFVSWVNELRPHLNSWVDSKDLRIAEFIQQDALRNQLTNTDPQIFRSFILDRWMTQTGV